MVQPGDIVVGDGDGVVVVPRADAARALVELRQIQAYEQERMDDIARGDLIPGWVDKVLAERGAVFVDDEGRPSR